MRDMPGCAEVVLHAIADDAKGAIDHPVLADIGVCAQPCGDIGPAVLPVTTEPAAIHEMLALVRHRIKRIARLMDEIIVPLCQCHHSILSKYMNISSHATSPRCSYPRDLLLSASSIACAM